MLKESAVYLMACHLQTETEWDNWDYQTQSEA